MKLWSVKYLENESLISSGTPVISPLQTKLEAVNANTHGEIHDEIQRTRLEIQLEDIVSSSVADANDICMWEEREPKIVISGIGMEAWTIR